MPNTRMIHQFHSENEHLSSRSAAEEFPPRSCKWDQEYDVPYSFQASARLSLLLIFNTLRTLELNSARKLSDLPGHSVLAMVFGNDFYPTLRSDVSCKET